MIRIDSMCLPRARGLAGAAILAIVSGASAQPSVIGQWDGPYTFGSPPSGTSYTPGLYEAIHMLHLPDYETHSAVIMYFDFSQAVLTWTWAPTVPPPPGVVYPVSGDFEFVWGFQPQDLVFCSGHSHLADGRVLIAGGDAQCSNIWIQGINSAYSWGVADLNLNQHASMAERRWYPTCTTLATGKVLTTGGTYQDPLVSGCGSVVTYGVTSVELFSPSAPATPPGAGQWTTLPDPLLSPGSLGDAPLYPFMFLLPSGNIYYAGSGDAGNTCLELDSTLQGGWQARPSSHLAGEHSTSAAMYLPGKILMCGALHGSNGEGFSEVVDLTATAPSNTWQQTGDMHHGRFHHNLVILPDGRVLATGGHQSHSIVPPLVGQYVREAEVFDPSTGTWTEWAAAPTDRAYHSTAVLLPDGRILSAGGDDEAGRPRPYLCEYFEPPYLHTGAVRPQIDASPSTIAIGQSIIVDVVTQPTNAVKASLVRLAATTHGFDQNQRYIPLELTNQSGRSLKFSSLASSAVAPPGDYMLFVLEWHPGTGQWVPSEAKYVRVL